QQRHRVAEQDDRQRLAGRDRQTGEAPGEEEPRGDAEADLHREEVPPAVDAVPAPQRGEVEVHLLADRAAARRRRHVPHPPARATTSQMTNSALTATATA